MKVGFIILFMCILKDGCSQINSKVIPVYFEKLKAGFDFKAIGDSTIYYDFCITNDSCFTIIKIFLLDEVGSYKMNCYRASDTSMLLYTYKGDKKLYTDIYENSFDIDGDIIKKTKKKMFTPIFSKSD